MAMCSGHPVNSMAFDDSYCFVHCLFLLQNVSYLPTTYILLSCFLFVNYFIQKCFHKFTMIFKYAKIKEKKGGKRNDNRRKN